MRCAIPVLAAVAFAALGRAQTGGHAELAAQTYYLRSGSRTLAGTQGAALNFEHFLPKVGVLSGNIEGYSSGSILHPADNFLGLRGFVWHNLRWNVNAGDFRAPGSLLRSPFTNLFFPEINARGISVEAGDNQRSFTLFYGRETILAGPRIPFRMDVPQRVMGASYRQRFGRLEAGSRLLFLQNSARESSDLYSPAGRNFRSAANLAISANYSWSEHFRWYGEVALGAAKSGDSVSPGQKLSYMFGPSWESPRLTLRANYASLGRSYFPLAGYWTGDHKGPFVEFRARPFRRVELFGSAVRSETASRAASLPFFETGGASAGSSVELSEKLNLSIQYSWATFRSSGAAEAAQHTSNRHWTGALSRSFGGHTFRVSARDMQVTSNGDTSRERSIGVEDTIRIGRAIALGGGVRFQELRGRAHRNGIQAHGSGQLNFGRFSAFGYFEEGKELADSTVFATTTTNSATLGASFTPTRNWSIRGEAFRSRLISQLNSESLFVRGDLNMALSPVLSRFNQWSFLFRVSRTFRWGAALPAGGLEQFTARQIPIKGVLEGVVWALTSNGRRPAAGVAVALESGSSTITDADGRYRFTELTVGPHIATLDMERLPADFNPGPRVTSRVTVDPRKVARADFEVLCLAGFAGAVAVRAGSTFESLEGIPIRLEPGGRYTSTAKDGTFAFYNIQEGIYTVRIDERGLPPEAQLTGDRALQVEIATGTSAPDIRFELERRQPGEKPVRRVLETILSTPSIPNQNELPSTAGVDPE